MANVVVSALATWNGKALKKAKQDVNTFDKQLKSLGRTLGVTFSAAALVSFSKKAVKAFSDDQAAAKRLQLQLENTGNAFRVTEVEAYIKSLEKTLGILDDLRGPFQTFLNATGSVELAQRSLEAALNISAGTGESLGTVVNAISAGIRGQTKAIKGLNTGIDESIIATGDMNKIMAALEKRFSGQSEARLDTYAGKMDMLKKGTDEATKSIGKGLVDALVILSKDKSVESLATDFENLGDNIAYAILEMAKLIKKFDDLVSNPSFKAGLLALAILSKKPSAVIGAMSIIGLDAAGSALTRSRGTAQSNVGGYSGIPDVKVAKELLRVTKDNVRYRKEENEQLKKKTAVDQLKDKFDLERIGLTVALNAATDEETKLRLKSQLAILDNNEALAKKYLAEMNAIKVTEEMIAALRVFVRATLDSIAPQMDAIKALIALSEQNAQNKKTFVSPSTPLMPPLPGLPASYFQNLGAQLEGSPSYAGMSAAEISMERLRESGNRPVNLTLTVDTANSGDRFSQLIAESIQLASRSGYGTTPAGSLP